MKHSEKMKQKREFVEGIERRLEEAGDDIDKIFEIANEVLEKSGYYKRTIEILASNRDFVKKGLPFTMEIYESLVEVLYGDILTFSWVRGDFKVDRALMSMAIKTGVVTIEEMKEQFRQSVTREGVKSLINEIKHQADKNYGMDLDVTPSQAGLERIKKFKYIQEEVKKGNIPIELGKHYRGTRDPFDLFFGSLDHRVAVIVKENPGIHHDDLGKLIGRTNPRLIDTRERQIIITDGKRHNYLTTFGDKCLKKTKKLTEMQEHPHPYLWLNQKEVAMLKELLDTIPKEKVWEIAPTLGPLVS